MASVARRASTSGGDLARDHGADPVGLSAIRDHDAQQLVRVADGYATAARPLLEAQAREHAAEELAADGLGDAARTQLGLAADGYVTLEAKWDLARADAHLRRYGIRRGVQGHRRRPKSGWAALTPTEGQIALLVSAGLSNPDIAVRTFTSRRTVQFHVSSILTKLDLLSRVELAAAVSRREANGRRDRATAGT
jgi:DNA-binding CsgD family transcriptional regulator